MKALAFIVLICTSSFSFSNSFTDKIKNFGICNVDGPRAKCKSAIAALTCLEKKYAESYKDIKEKMESGKKIHFFLYKE